VHEIGIRIASALAVRLGEEIMHRLRAGRVDAALIEDVVSDHSFDFEVHFPTGAFIVVRRRAHRELHRSKEAQPKAQQSLSYKSGSRKRKGRRARRK
jgi:hypothetical protein